ncbi:RNA polymerase sigma24 factor [Streptomyces longispororuber]|uniref:RNA polymerase sigma24 factor n=2 Tax=Streptomyces longispororuber TaxID=68230 RepID=A0A918Z4P9_9ACTN|nr:RNA polymerase sigma24 factor [Streptomyces longispororuber]
MTEDRDEQTTGTTTTCPAPADDGRGETAADDGPHVTATDNDRMGTVIDDAKRMETAARTFVVHRNLLFTVAYELLGSAADAEDVLQETWLRWAGVDLGAVRDQRAYLVRMTTRQALTRLRTLRRRKESYVGPWLPEPLLTAPDVADDVELADSVSMAMLLVLETLAPTERAVFVLREVFELAYDDIAEAVEKTPAAVRQIAHRARAHVAARRPRGLVTPAETRAALAAFRRALETGDVQRLLDVIAPDVVLLTDGGGVVRAALAPVVGAEAVARVLGRIHAGMSLRQVQVNGHPALVLRLDGRVDTVLAVRVDDGLVTGLYAVRNPEKLARHGRATAEPLSR